MAKIKIQKNLSDADMFKGFTEEETFENAMLRGEGLRQAKIAKKRAVENKQDAFYREFLTEKIETQIGKMLLEIKMEYYKDGINNFYVQVKKEGKNIVLETGAKKLK